MRWESSEVVQFLAHIGFLHATQPSLGAWGASCFSCLWAGLWEKAHWEVRFLWHKVVSFNLWSFSPRYINESGVDPINKEPLSLEQLIEVNMFTENFRKFVSNSSTWLQFKRFQWLSFTGEMFTSGKAKTTIGDFDSSDFEVSPGWVGCCHAPQLHSQARISEKGHFDVHPIKSRQQLQTARQELSHALYQHDAACRVIARSVKYLVLVL